MADEPVTPEVKDPVEETVAADRFREVAKHKKAAEERAKELEKQLEQLQQDMQERDQAKLPDLERERKRAEQLEKQLAEATQAREQMERETASLRKQDWVKEAAREANFHNPSVAARLAGLDEIESAEDAQRAVKKLVKQDPYLVKPDEPVRPEIGRVLTNGRPEQAAAAGPADLNDPAFRRQMGEEMLQVLRGNK